MTDETKKRLPGIIERIGELRDEVEKIHMEKVEECKKKRDDPDRTAQIITAIKAEQLYGAYASLDRASRLLTNY